ncbi:MAG: response regulator transcription factor [Propioniciclava sp.]
MISPGPTRRLLATHRQARGVVAPGSVAMARSVGLLTQREREVIALVARGSSNQEICDALWLSMPTIKTHIGNLLAKTQSRDRVHLVLYALRAGLATIP